MTAQANTNADNGVNVEALLGAREALTQMPAAGQFKWRTSSKWVSGAHTKMTMNGFFGLGEEQDRGKSFTIESDHPEIFAASDHAPTPLEIVLSGLAACLTGGIASVAQHRGIQLRSVEAVVEGDVDLAGILGIDEDTRNGFSGIRVHFNIDADASEDDIAALVAQSQKRSAIFDVITNPTNVFVSVN